MKCNIVLKVNDISYEFSSEQELNEKLLELLSTEALNTPSISHVRWSISEAHSAERTDHLLGEIRSRVNEIGYEVEKKKMIVNCLIKRVEVSRGYKLKVEFNIDFEQFMVGIDKVA